MNYSIIGSGKVGSALARHFVQKSINVAVANSRGPESIAQFVRELEGKMRAVHLAEALEADIVILAAPFPALQNVARAKADWSGQVIIDAMNRLEEVGGPTSSEVVAEAFPGAKVVKAFNQLPAAILARDPSQDGGRRVVFVSSNHEDASATVADLARQLGFAPIELGRLDEGGRLIQFHGPLVLHDLIEHEFD
jgi:8-hydroxy-5-deazaflavin:NADPH oxidoreductase